MYSSASRSWPSGNYRYIYLIYGMLDRVGSTRTTPHISLVYKAIFACLADCAKLMVVHVLPWILIFGKSKFLSIVFNLICGMLSRVGSKCKWYKRGSTCTPISIIKPQIWVESQPLSWNCRLCTTLFGQILPPKNSIIWTEKGISFYNPFLKKFPLYVKLLSWISSAFKRVWMGFTD